MRFFFDLGLEGKVALAGDLARNREQFESFIAYARAELRQGDLTSAAALCQVAANWAWHRHQGAFFNADLERLVQHIASAANWEAFQEPVGSDPSRADVLHVLTEAYEVGGHTRLAWRWIERDPRSANVVLTQQGNRPVPSALVAAANSASGGVIDLGEGNADLLERARRLRRLARAHDYVVLHVHPYDVLPSLALAPLSVPVLFVNHADHVFWVNSNVSNVVVNFRYSGRDLAAGRRRIGARHLCVLPLALDMERKPESLERDTYPRVLSVATSGKYGRVDGVSYQDLLKELVTERSDVQVHIVGPAAEGEWASIRDATGGRIEPTGLRQDVDTFYSRADLYLDSFPFSSVTSLLEAATYGVPVITLAPPAGAEVLGADDPALPPHLVQVGSVEEFRQRALYLLDDVGERQLLGRLLRAGLVESRSRESWRNQLAEVYQAAGTTHRIGHRAVVDQPPDMLDHILVERQRSQMYVSFARIWELGAAWLPLGKRIRYALRFAIQGRAVSRGALLSTQEAHLLKLFLQRLRERWR